MSQYIGKCIYVGMSLYRFLWYNDLMFVKLPILKSVVAQILGTNSQEKQ